MLSSAFGVYEMSICFHTTLKNTVFKFCLEAIMGNEGLRDSAVLIRGDLGEAFNSYSLASSESAGKGGRLTGSRWYVIPRGFEEQ